MTLVLGIFRQTVLRWQKPLEAGYFTLLLLAFVTNGANTTLSFSICLIFASGLCLLALAVLGAPDRTATPFAAGVWLLVGFTLWIVVQILPVPDSLAFPIWREPSRFGIETAGHISAAPAESIAGWQRLALPFIAFLSGLVIFRTDEQALRAAKFVTLAGGVLAIICLLQLLFMPGWLLFSQKLSYDDSYTFVFVNRNTAATCLGLLLLLQIVNVRQEWLSLDKTRLIAWVMNGVRLPKSVHLYSFALQLGLLLVFVLCLALTKSRAGIGSSAIAAAVVVVLLSWHGGGAASPGFSRRRRSLWKKVAQALLSTAGVLFVIALFAPRAILRGEMQGIDDARFCINDGLFAAARDNWLTGGGFGAFSFVFNPYRDPICGIQSVWDKAHNSYLEGFIGLGILFVPLLLAGLWGLMRCYRTGIRERRNLMLFPIIGIGGLFLVLLHSLADFSMQIPGMATFFACFAALTVTISVGRRRSGGKNAAAEQALPPPQTMRFTPAILAGIALLSLVLASYSLKDGIAMSGVRTFARALDSETVVDSQALHRLVAEGLPSNRLTGCNGEMLRATLTVLLADLDRVDRDRSYDEWVERLSRAESQVVHAISCTPADGNLWLRLAMLRQAGGEVPQEQAALMTLAQELNPSERRQLVGRLAQWNRLSATTLAMVGEEVAADVRNGLNYLPVADIRVVFAAPSAPINAIVKDTLPLLPADRRELLRKRGLDWIDAEDRKSGRYLQPTEG